MPFVNERQRIACYARNDPNWDCKKWNREKKKLCGAVCKDGNKCKRKCTTKKCWQHKKKRK